MHAAQAGIAEQLLVRPATEDSESPGHIERSVHDKREGAPGGRTLGSMGDIREAGMGSGATGGSRGFAPARLASQYQQEIASLEVHRRA
jgi:hypothetical protein